MLEYNMIKDGRTIDSGLVGKHDLFMYLQIAIRTILEKYPTKYPSVYECFLTTNDSIISEEKVTPLLNEYKELGKEKILVNELFWKNKHLRIFTLQGQNTLTKLNQFVDQLIDENGYNLVMTESDFHDLVKGVNRDELIIPYPNIGDNELFFGSWNNKRKVIVFQSKSFIIRSLDIFYLFQDKKDQNKKFILPLDRGFSDMLIEDVEYKNTEIRLARFNMIYEEILSLLVIAKSKKCSIEWILL